LQNAVGTAIEVAAITQLTRQLAGLDGKIARIGTIVDSLSVEQTKTNAELASLLNEFHVFVAADARYKELAIAETRLVKTRQEIEKRFGSHDEVRKRTTGILRSVDAALVREETIRTATEELMLACPRYWLAPALVAISAWIGDHPELAEKALGEALRRDDYKTSLLLALVSRRAGRYTSAAIWLDRYFRLQDAYALDREVSVLLDAVAWGAFGREATAVLNSGINGWLTEVSSNPAFVEQERTRWREAFASMRGPVNDAEYPYLAKYSASWPSLRASLSGAAGNGTVLSFLGQVFDGEIVLPPSLELRIDDILNRLVTEFDDEELGLRRTERLLELIVESDGDRARADELYNVEKGTFDEKASFGAILTGASLAQHENTGMSRATQRLAIALSKPWAAEAHSEHIAAIRATRPQNAKLALQEWSGIVTSGQDEDRLVNDVVAHFDDEEKRLLTAVWSWQVWIPGVIAVLSVFAAVNSRAWLLLAVLCALVQVGSYLNRRKRSLAIQAASAQNREAGITVVRASVAEWVDYSAAWTEADGVAKRVHETFEQMVPDQFFAGNSRDRRIA
jgi:hypothetical protein